MPSPNTYPLCVRLDQADNVVVLPNGGGNGDALPGGQQLRTTVPPGHKAAAVDIARDASVIKYGQRIGIATVDISAGEWVHDHNVRTALSPELTISPRAGTRIDIEAWRKAMRKSLPDHGLNRLPVSFKAYHRPDGRVGIRNELWIIPTVGCINKELHYLIRDLAMPEWIDAIQVLEHPYGCSQLGDDLEYTRRILSALARHPNAAGVVVAGLGCENLAPAEVLRDLSGPSVRSITLQNDPGESLAKMLLELADATPRFREAAPLDKLVVGVKCGGSDGLSGLTANPLISRAAEWLAAQGCLVLATEIPEMFGAENVLLERMANRETADKFLALAQWFRDYYVNHGQPVYENPSPGNRAGGITTLEEKSLGAVEKLGKTPIVSVLAYGETLPAGASGAAIVFGPGNDLVSTTALAASGAHLILFATGRGTPFGSIVPTVKISSNSAVYERHSDWLDFDAGTLLQPGADWDSVTADLLASLFAAANGEKTRNELKNASEIAIFKNGITL